MEGPSSKEIQATQETQDVYRVRVEEEALFTTLATTITDTATYLEQYWYVLTSFLLVGTLLYSYLMYTFVVDPLLYILLQSKRLQLQVQGYMIDLIEILVEAIFQRVFDYEVDGMEHIDKKSLAVVLSNHQGFCDYLTLMNFADRCGVDNSNFFFVYKHCVRLPSIQVLINAWRGQINWEVPNMGLAEVFAPVLESPWRGSGGKWVCLFPEVLPWSQSRMVVHRQECEKNGAPKLKNLLYPTFQAFVQAVEHLRDVPHGLAIYEIAITYVDKAKPTHAAVPNWGTFLFGKKNWIIKLEVRRHNASQMFSNEKRLKGWLEKEWVKMDARISETKKQLANRSPENKAPVPQ